MIFMVLLLALLPAECLFWKYFHASEISLRNEHQVQASIYEEATKAEASHIEYHYTTDQQNSKV